MGITKNKSNVNDTIVDVGNAIVSDVLDGRGGRCVFGYGVKDSGRVESLFGFTAGNYGKNGKKSDLHCSK